MSKIIVIEGLDGSGKSTQFELLHNYLKENNLNFEHIHFPRTEESLFGELIAKFLRGEFGELESVHPYLVALIYAGDRYDAKKIISKWIESDKIIILDRYIYSNIAFQCAKIKDLDEKEKLKKWILNLEYDYFKIPKPDISIFLNVPIGFIENNLSNERDGESRAYLDGKVDIHEKDIKFQESVLEEYLNLSSEKYFNIIDCCDENKILPSEEIHNKVLNLIKDKGII